MLGLLRRRQLHSLAHPPTRRFRPALEGLEARDCPSGSSSDALWYILNTQPVPISDGQGPALTLAVSYNQKRNVTLSGKVTDTQPAGLSVSFGGEVAGSAVTDANGNFSLTAAAAALGTVTASVLDGVGLSASAQVSLTSKAPVITAFQAVPGLLGAYVFSGSVTDESPCGLQVAFGGNPVSVAGKTAAVDAAGNFSSTIQLNGQTSDNGTVTAQTTDWWGLKSNVASVTISQGP